MALLKLRLMTLVLEDSRALFQPCALLTDTSSEVGFYSFLYSRDRKPKAIVCRHFKLKLQEQVTQRLPHTSSYRSQANVTAGSSKKQLSCRRSCWRLFRSTSDCCCHKAPASQPATMYCLQWLLPVLLIPKPLNPALWFSHSMFMGFYLLSFLLERKPCTICALVFLAALFLICYSCWGNCFLYHCTGSQLPESAHDPSIVGT
uniref:BLCAP apoptosis inducing factor n=1 Tax=Aquila chrysaetos chrysaetos TaxID=223781 RepID=A0A663ESF3_AQUCH